MGLGISFSKIYTMQMSRSDGQVAGAGDKNGPRGAMAVCSSGGAARFRNRGVSPAIIILHGQGPGNTDEKRIVGAVPSS
jgi:hypothetical protein